MATSAIEPLRQLNFLRGVHASYVGVLPLKTGPKTIEQTIRELAQKAQQKMKTNKTTLLMEQVAWLEESKAFFDEFFRERITKRFAWNLVDPVVTDNEFAAAAVADIIDRNSFTNYSVIIEGAGTGL
jgi:hypothetical protein